MSDKLIKLSDAIDVIKKNHYRLEGHGLTEELLLEQMCSIPSADRWIPCSERLPSEQGQYLVTFPLSNGDPWVYVLSFCKGKFYETDDEWGDAEYDDVTAWMPLPEPWKGADDETD